MATAKQVVGARTALAAAAIATLASAAYGVSSVKDNTANQPLDLMVELSVTPGTTAGNKQALLFAKASYDNANWQSGPESGATTTDQADLTFLGALPLNTTAGQQTKSFSVAACYGGVLPPYLKFIVFNDSGAAFTAATISTVEISATVV